MCLCIIEFIKRAGGGGGGRGGGDKMRGSYRFHQRALIKIEMQDFTYYVCMSLK